MPKKKKRTERKDPRIITELDRIEIMTIRCLLPGVVVVNLTQLRTSSSSEMGKAKNL